MTNPFSPSKAQLELLKLASSYGFDVWNSSTLLASEFLSKYPLEQVLSTEAIHELVTKWTNTPNEQTNETELNALKQSLRQLRKLMMLRWIWADALDLISLENLTRELSDFADGCLRIAKNFVYDELKAKYGEPIAKDGEMQTLIIVAMGKLGAQELNLSSDIDLVFLYGRDGYTQAQHESQKQIEIKRFMITWGQRIIRIIDDVTAEGFVHRVDMRLRPWGDGSALAINLNALQIYFTKHGRHWERFAWLKARVVSGFEFAQRLDDIIKAFVYRYYVDYTAFAALREMKNLITTQQKQRFDEDNVKLGAGGIRDIEFIVQAYQLIYGGTKPDLQVKPCLQALSAINRHGFVEDDVAMNLAAAYRFLRRSEHAIQALHDKQTQKLPQQEDERVRIATVLGFKDWQGYLTQLNAHKANVIAPFQKLVLERTKNDDGLSGEEEAKLCEQNIDDASEEKLQAFLQSSAVQRLPSQAATRLNDVWSEVRIAIAASGNAPLATERMLTFLEAVINRSIYLVLLKENPNALHHLVKMVTASPWISHELTRYPVLLDEFLLKRSKQLPSKDELRDNLQQRLLRVEPEDEESQLGVLRLFKKSQVLHVAAKDLLAAKPLMKVSDSLTFIAEVVLEATLKLVYLRTARQYGFPKLNSGERATEEKNGFGIIGYGKLGGIELSYSSDLDVVFLHDINEQAETDGAKPISGMRFVTRVGQRLMTLLGAQTRDGRAYEIDTRLRPSGQSGVLVSSLAAFSNYQKHSAWLWEHQALVRARPICGDAKVLAQFEQIRKQTLCAERAIAEVRAEVINMRQKMRDHLGSSRADTEAGRFHLKQDEGGIVDIEFMAQFCVLVLGHNHTELTNYPDNVRIFNQLAELADSHELYVNIDEADCAKLVEIYLQQRAATHHLALAKKSLQVQASDWQTTRAFVQKMWVKLVASPHSSD